MFVCVSGVGRETRPHSATVLHFITGPPSLENGLEGEWGAFRGLPTTAKGGCGGGGFCGGGLRWRFISFHTPTSFSPFHNEDKEEKGFVYSAGIFFSPLRTPGIEGPVFVQCRISSPSLKIRTNSLLSIPGTKKLEAVNSPFWVGRV